MSLTVCSCSWLIFKAFFFFSCEDVRKHWGCKLLWLYSCTAPSKHTAFTFHTRKLVISIWFLMNHIEFQRWISKLMGTEMNILNTLKEMKFSCPMEAFYGGPAMSLCGNRWVGISSNPECLSLSTVDTWGRIILCPYPLDAQSYPWPPFTRCQWYSLYLCYSPDKMTPYGGPWLYLIVLCSCSPHKDHALHWHLEVFSDMGRGTGSRFCCCDKNTVTKSNL